MPMRTMQIMCNARLASRLPPRSRAAARRRFRTTDGSLSGHLHWSADRWVIRNPVVEYTYAKEDRVVASCDYGRVGAPLQESEGPRRTLSPSDRMAAERGKEDRGGVRGHRLQPRLGAQNSPPLQRVGSGRAGRPSPLQPRRQGEGAAG